MQKLSTREIEILKLISCGLTSKEVASRLFISINTVETHRKHILKKLKSKNMFEAIFKSVATKTTA